MRVWVRWRKIDGISFLKVVLETESVVAFARGTIFSFYLIQAIVNFLPISSPPYLMFPKGFLWESQRFDAIAKHWFIFVEVYDIESDSVVGFGVVDFEVKPLVVAFGVCVILENQIVSLDVVSWW